MNGGPSLSVDEIDGTEDLEERGKQDLGQKAATSPFAEALSQTSPSTKKAGVSGNASSANGHSKASNGNGAKSKKTAKA